MALLQYMQTLPAHSMVALVRTHWYWRSRTGFSQLLCLLCCICGHLMLHGGMVLITVDICKGLPMFLYDICGWWPHQFQVVASSWMDLYHSLRSSGLVCQFLYCSFLFVALCSATTDSYVRGHLHPKGKSHTKWPLHIQTATFVRWQFESADH